MKQVRWTKEEHFFVAQEIAKLLSNDPKKMRDPDEAYRMFFVAQKDVIDPFRLKTTGSWPKLKPYIMDALEKLIPKAETPPPPLVLRDLVVAVVESTKEHFREVFSKLVNKVDKIESDLAAVHTRLGEKKLYDERLTAQIEHSYHSFTKRYEQHLQVALQSASKALEENRELKNKLAHMASEMTVIRSYYEKLLAEEKAAIEASRPDPKPETKPAQPKLPIEPVVEQQPPVVSETGTLQDMVKEAFGKDKLTVIEGGLKGLATVKDQVIKTKIDVTIVGLDTVKEREVKKRFEEDFNLSFLNTTKMSLKTATNSCIGKTVIMITGQCKNTYMDSIRKVAKRPIVLPINSSMSAVIRELEEMIRSVKGGQVTTVV